jgi:hypothetical protein
MVLDGSQDKTSPPPAPDPENGNEVDPATVDHLEFYLLNYFKAAHYEQTIVMLQTEDGTFSIKSGALRVMFPTWASTTTVA